jgi:phage gp46-like protein
MTTDVILNDKKGYYDFEWTESGDISTDQTLDTFILMCVMEEVRASASEVPQSNLRRGWIGNESTPGFEQGSKTWLFEQEKITGSIMAELGAIVRNSLQPLIDEGLAEDVIVHNPFLKSGKVTVNIDLFRSGSKVEQKSYELWNNTGNF